MRPSIVAIITLVSIASSLPTKLIPRQSSTVTLTIKTGDGDSATTLSCTLDQVCSTNFLNRNTVQTSLDQPNVFCAGFTDSGATQLIQPVFNSAIPASYSSTSNGGTNSVASDAIPVGSYFCSASQNSVTSRSSGTSSNSNVASAASSAAPPPPASTGSSSTSGETSAGNSATVIVQLEQSADQFVQATIPLDATPVPNSPQLGNQGLDLSLVLATGFDINQVGCQVFADRAGTQPIGGIATVNAQVVLSQNQNAPAMIGSIACGAVTG